MITAPLSIRYSRSESATGEAKPPWIPKLRQASLSGVILPETAASSAPTIPISLVSRFSSLCVR